MPGWLSGLLAVLRALAPYEAAAEALLRWILGAAASGTLPPELQMHAAEIIRLPLANDAVEAKLRDHGDATAPTDPAPPATSRP